MRRTVTANHHPARLPALQISIDLRLQLRQRHLSSQHCRRIQLPDMCQQPPDALALFEGDLRGIDSHHRHAAQNEGQERRIQLR